MRTRTTHALLAALTAGALLGWPAQPAVADTPTSLSDEEIAEIAVDAYVYAYPLVLMDVTRQVMTNTETPDPKTTRAPINQFFHADRFPDPSFTDVVRPNADTLYSFIWFDVSKEPLVFDVPDSGGRYYLLPMLDFWTDIFASPGKRTTGTQAQKFAVASRDWSGKLPVGVELIRSPTNFGWMIGRTQTNGTADYENVRKFQAGLKAVPLSAWRKDYTPPRGKVDPNILNTSPEEQVAKMDAATLFARFAELTKENPPHANDYPILARMKRIGLEPGKSFDIANARPAVRDALTAAAPKALKKIKEYQSDKIINGWIMVMSPIGTYGTDYLKRAEIAYAGLGANCVEDAIYPFAMVQTDGKPFDSAARYTLHFKKEEIPPARAFWSLTMYNEKQFFTENPIHRYAIGDRDKLRFNDDGSLTLYIQRDSPGGDKESNWLPAPKQGKFSMNLRLYWPKPEALDGTWKPPAIREVSQ